MEDNKSSLYAAFKAKDSRFDGRFFVGISSTGIYCRPVCKAKQPKIENCTFYTTAAEAEQAGYRPCLLCRPELAPGTSIADATADLVKRTARTLEENCGSGQSLYEIATRFGCTDRHLRRVFTSEYNVSPVQYLQTCRLLLAKNLLTDTDLSVLDVAMASGFGSLRRFNDLFKKNYNLSPTALRKQRTKGKNEGITLALGYRPPYQWEQVLSFIEGRAIKGVEVVKNGEYYRTASIMTDKRKTIQGWLKVGHNPKKNLLTVTVSETLLPVLPQVLARVKHQFDLYCDPHAVYETLASMNNIRPNLCILGTRLPGSFNSYEMAIRAILGQQITVKAASTLAARIVQVFGTPINTEIEGLTHIFPSPEKILALDGNIENYFGELGVTSARSRTILELTKAIIEGEIDFDFCPNPEEEMKKLMNIKGIGSWTAQYIAMRAMKWTDSFLETDVGIKKALEGYSAKKLLEMAENWRPWRSYATINLWNSL